MPSTESETFKERILIVDGDEIARGYLETLFSYHGYEIRTVKSGKEALHILSEEYYPVVVADLNMHDISGIQVLDYIQQKEIMTAVLIITAYGSLETVTEALRHGAYDYLTKPFTSQILIHRVSRAMEKIRMEMTAREVTSRIVYATEEERLRISRDLHDEVGQSLAIMKLTLMTIKNKILNNSSEDIISEIQGLARQVEETMNEVSRISKNLSPSYVVEVGLSQALRLYIETFTKKTGIHVDSYLSEIHRFQNSQNEIHLYRIAQEALTNIAKHSGATSVMIRLRNAGGILYFSISDNGKGFNLTKNERAAGMGFIGIRERVAILGGNVWIESDPGYGTTVRTEIPYE
ncbi:MAG: response regulator [Nitrospirae bacterium]|nr:response regulator [Nitrospirota bacterium]